MGGFITSSTRRQISTSRDRTFGVGARYPRLRRTLPFYREHSPTLRSEAATCLETGGYLRLSRLAFNAARAGVARVRLTRLLKVLKHKKANGRRQIALFARSVDSGDQFRQRYPLEMSNFLEISPEGIFKANAGLVSINHDGPFGNG